MKRILFILSVLFSSSVFAEERPDKIACEVIRGAAAQCIDPNRPKTERYYYQDDNGNTRVGTRNTWVVVRCVQGICSDMNDNPRGEVVIDSRFLITIPVDYYLKDIGGSIFAVRQGVTVSGSKASETLDIWCNPLGDTCSTPKGELSREALPKHFKFADANDSTLNCPDELCYNQNQDVVGLNPNYSLYQ